MIGTVENSDVLKENKLKFMDSIERKMKHQQSNFSLLINIIILIFFFPVAPRCFSILCRVMLSAKCLIQGLRRKHSQALPFSLSLSLFCAGHDSKRRKYKYSKKDMQGREGDLFLIP
jgi:hypothetical protein